MNDKLLEYFNGDELAVSTWFNKYAIDGELTPDDMHRRMAKEFAKIEKRYELFNHPTLLTDLSPYGQKISFLDEDTIYQLFKDFKYVIPGGSVMATLGSNKLSSLSNCFVIDSPKDSISGIMNQLNNQSQLMKYRGGVGFDISTLRPMGSTVSNAAKTSTGAASFMDLFSNVTNTIAQNGRRGALMLSMNINHPDIKEFITKKQDLSKVTGANVSVQITDDFMNAVERDKDYILRWPIDLDITGVELFKNPYNELIRFGEGYIKRVKSKELWDTLIHCAHNTAEPGIMFIDRIHNYSPDGTYDDFRAVSTNPCFHPDTLIDTVEGRKRIADITDPIYVYSMSKEGNLVIVPCSAAFKTKLNAKTIKITLRNGSSIQITPDHKLYVHDRGWVQAKELNIGDRVVHLLRGRRGKKYVGAKLTTQGNREYKMEHRLVYEGVFGYTSDDIHHIDGNTFNNCINNLESLPHTEHSRMTALEQNPQTHQERDKNGRFSLYEENKQIQGIVNLPYNLATNFKSKWDNSIISIEEGDTVDVYDIQVPETNCLVANNMIAHNCGEIPMGPYDSCRLMHLNLTSFVENSYTPDVKLKDEELYNVAYMTMRLSDDLIDLEIEAIDKIIRKIKKSGDTNELILWENIRKTTINGRRTGMGFTGLADVIAMFNYKYGDNDSLLLTNQIMNIIMTAQLDCTIDLSLLRGAFPAYNEELEFGIVDDILTFTGSYGTNDFYEFIKINYPRQFKRMYNNYVSRRNISWSTVAPTGTVSLLTQTSSGIEPVFLPYYQRRRKCSSPDDRVDYIDNVGEKYTEFFVLHPEFKKWINLQIDTKGKIYNILDKESLEQAYKDSPWYNSTASEINWENRIQMQSIIQKYTTHAISSTLNLNSNITENEVSNIYMNAWHKGLKGITIYRDGSRSGILNSIKEEDTEPKRQAKKRPKVLVADYYQVKSKGKQYIVLVGLLNNKPYEIFTFQPLHDVDIKSHKGTITKLKKGQYAYDSDYIQIANLELSTDNIEEKACSLYTSMLLRHNADIKFIIKTAKKVNDNITSFSSAMCRVLSKYVENEEVKGEICSECGGKLIRESGCIKCLDCDYSKCL